MDDKTKLVEKLQANGCKYLMNWKDYKVYGLIYKGSPEIGLPLFILENAKETKVTTPEEGFEILNLLPDEDNA